MGRRRKPSRGPVNWTVVIVAGLLTLCIGVTVVLLSPGGRAGRIVVPQPSESPPAAVKTDIQPAGAEATTQTSQTSQTTQQQTKSTRSSR